MKPAAFRYEAPETLAAVLAILADADDAKVLAGGQSLVPMMNLRLVRPSILLDLNRVPDVRGEIGRTSDGGWLRVPALTRHAALSTAPAVLSDCPLLAKAARHIGHTQIRHRGTVGGSLAHADPSAELPLVAITLDAIVELRSARGVRELPAGTFHEGAFTTQLEVDEVLVGVRVPVADRALDGFAEFSRREGDYAIVAAAVRVPQDGAPARVCVAGVDGCAIRLPDVEDLLTGRVLTSQLADEAGRLAADRVDPADDALVSARFRRQLTRVLVTRALEDAMGTDGREATRP